MTENTTPTLGPIKRHAGIAGQFAVSVTATYPGEEPMAMQFVGSTYGGPVVMAWGDQQSFVTDPGQYGEFAVDPQRWVRRFYGVE